uniref:Mitogen-activated protein kinase n=2 Tax=Kalmanozyma brasiliensis (strain GHG001) TaxID=1365824 RepID=V5EUX2_KALBG
MSPQPNAVASSSSAALVGSGKATPPPQPQSPSSSSSVHQVGSRQGTRTRTRTRRNVSSSTSGSHRTPRYTNEDHPLAPHNLATRGYHSFRCLGVPFHVKQRYTFVRELGIGAYGCVALCRDEVLECNVAIKKVTRIFEKDVLARRALREVALLRHIGLCDNVTALLDFDTAFIDFSEIYLVLSASEADLSQIIRSGQSLSDAHHQYFMAQILRGVRYMHSAKVIHRDLKPSNLLVNGDCALRICDLGLARAYADSDEFLAPPATNDDAESKPRSSIGSSVEDDRTDARQSSPDTDAAQAPQQQQQPRSGSARSPSPASDLHVQLYKTDSKGKQKRLNYPGGPLTGYVATRWYRAPEVMLCFREGYGPEMDMWSVGCILAELIGGGPIFGGKDYVDQIARINNVLGSPSETVLDKIGSERAKTYIKSLPHMPAVPLEKLYPNANPEALDLVAKLLTWDPDQRLTAEEALRHPWLKAYHESNARWQAPQPFDKFAEVEFIHSLRQFKTSLQREADEMRMELEELEREELEHLGDGGKANGESNGNGNGEHHEAHQDMEPVVADGQNGHHAANAEAQEPARTEEEEASDEQQSGNVQGADEVADLRAQSDERRGVDADAPHSDFPPYYHASGDEGADSDSQDADALSCNASSQSAESLPADTASSSSSIHTPSSISGASADEAEPASPRMYETCALSTALKSRAEHLEEGKALRKPPSFFQLGHEVEGRRSVGAFMPHQVLTVARGLVEYQTTAADAVREPTYFPSSENAASSTSDEQQDGMRSRCDTIKASALSNSSSTVAGGKAAGASAASTSASSSSSRGGSASTPSLGQSLLDDMLFAPADGSSSGLKSVSSQRHGKQLVVLQDSIVQSSVSLMRDMIARSTQRNHAVLLVTTLRSPATYLDGHASDKVAVIDATMLGDVFAVDAGDAVKTIDELVERIRTQLSALSANMTKTTVVIDSLNAVAHAAGEETGVAMTSKLVRETLGSVGASSRVIVGLQMGGVEASTHAGLLSTLHSPLIWGAASAGSGGTLLSVAIHAPALLRHVYKQYGLKPPCTPAASRRVLGLDGGDDADEVDTRFWDVLKNVASRGPMGIAAYEAGGGTQGWWAGEGCAFESLDVVETGSGESESTAGVITLADLLNPARTGYAVLELHYHARNGKTHEELVGLVTAPSTQLVPLDMVDRTTTATPTATATPAPGDAHSSMISTLPFNLGETTDQRERRETVPLPYAYHQHQESLRGTTGNAHIFFEPEQDDDEDDEDPDDDLDL